MTKTRKMTTIVFCGALATVTSAAAYAASNYCIAVNGGFGGGGTSFIAPAFTLPAAGECAPWEGFTKTASTVVLITSGTGCLSTNGKVLSVSVSSADPSFFGTQPGQDYITLCPAGVTGCPISGQDQGSFDGTAEPQNCTKKLLTLPPTHD